MWFFTNYPSIKYTVKWLLFTSTVDLDSTSTNCQCKLDFNLRYFLWCSRTRTSFWTCRVFFSSFCYFRMNNATHFHVVTTVGWQSREVFSTRLRGARGMKLCSRTFFYIYSRVTIKVENISSLWILPSFIYVHGCVVGLLLSTSRIFYLCDEEKKKYKCEAERYKKL